MCKKEILDLFPLCLFEYHYHYIIPLFYLFKWDDRFVLYYNKKCNSLLKQVAQIFWLKNWVKFDTL